MNLLEQARLDAKSILNGEFSTELTITPTNGLPVVINGLATRHSNNWDTDGIPVTGDNCHCSFYEKDLNDLGVVTRNAANNVIVKDWLVSFDDGIATNTFEIAEPQPDTTLGIIRCLLSFYE